MTPLTSYDSMYPLCTTHSMRSFHPSTSPGKDHEDGDFLRDINPRSLQVTPLSHASYYAHTNLALASVRHQLLSLQVLTNAVVEPSLASAKPGTVNYLSLVNQHLPMVVLNYPHTLTQILINNTRSYHPAPYH